MIDPTKPNPFRYDTVLNELIEFAKWVRAGNYNHDDARDEIARALENRVRHYTALKDKEMQESIDHVV